MILYLDRGAWGADRSLPRHGHLVPRAQFRGIVTHHTVIPAPSPTGSPSAIAAYMQRLQKARPDLGLDVPYSFVVFAGTSPHDGIVCEGRGWDRTGAHTAGLNSSRYGVAYGGDLRTDPLTEGMLEAVRWVGRHIIPGSYAPTTGHSDHKNTECPSVVGELALPLIQPPYDPATIAQEDEDMPHVWESTTTHETWLCRGDIRRVLADQHDRPTGREFARTAGIPIYSHPNAHLIVGDMYPVVA